MVNGEVVDKVDHFTNLGVKAEALCVSKHEEVVSKVGEYLPNNEIPGWTICQNDH